MKRFILLSALALTLFICGETIAQGRFGVMGGINFSKIERQSLNRSSMTKYHVGLTYQLKLPLGFSIQPALLYNVKGAKLAGLEYEGAPYTSDMEIGYLEVPVSIQWGPDLLLFRPFLDITPFVGYGLHNKLDVSSAGISSMKNIWDSASLNRFEYGLGLGVGLEVWKFQLIGRYNWNLGSLYNLKTDIDAGFNQVVKNALANKSFGGFTLTASFLF